MLKSLTKKLFVFFLIFTLFIISIPQKSQAEFEILNEEKEVIEILFFGSPTCPHCLAEKSFLKDLQKKYPEITISEYTLSANIKLVSDLYLQYEVPKNKQGLVPATFISNTNLYFIGFNDSIGLAIEDHVKNILEEGSSENKKIDTVKVPFLGKINLYEFSLPILAIVLGVVDGFNVCSLGALVIILGLVIVLGSRKRILILGGIFLLITTLTYGLLMLMWHRLFSILSPYIKSMELFIGVLSVIGGIYLAREFFKSIKQGPACSSGGIIAKLSPKVEKVFSNKRSLAILIGVVSLFALAITIIEFPCSAFLPVLFTGILVEANISMNLTLSYLGIFLLFYMLDEIIIFLIAVLSMKIKIVSPKFINFFTLLAALIFLFLGMFYIYRIF